LLLKSILISLLNNLKFDVKISLPVSFTNSISIISDSILFMALIVDRQHKVDISVTKQSYT
jgi:hypothetical protein